jgi:hypothetical protein
MENIKTAIELRYAIQELELKTAEQKQALEDKFHDTVEGLKPRNLLKKYVGNFLTEPLKNGALNLGLAAGTGFIVRKVLLRNTTGKFAKLLVNLVQLGVSGFVAAKASKSKELKSHNTY